MTGMFTLLGRYLLIAGILIALVGAALALLGDKLPRSGHLPGDVIIQRPGFTFYFPLGACLVGSLLLTLLIWIVNLLRR